MRNESGFEPLGHAVIVKPYEVEYMTGSGIVLPESAKERQSMAEQRAVVIAVGPECWPDEKGPRAVPGDKIMFTKYAGKAATGPADGKQYRVINDSDIFLRITEEREEYGIPLELHRVSVNAPQKVGVE